MKTTPITEIKALLSEYIRKVKAGQSFTITDRGLPVAKLVPVTPIANNYDDIMDLVNADLVRLPEMNLDKSFLIEPEIKDASGRALEILLEDREKSW